jgi:hypothetical protein
MEGMAAALEVFLRLSAVEKADLRERARSRVMENFEIGRVVREYENFYDELGAAAPR